MTELEREIRSEIAKAIQSLGGSPQLVATIEGQDQKRDVRRSLGADRYLLATIDSRGDPPYQRSGAGEPHEMERGGRGGDSPGVTVDFTDEERAALINLLLSKSRREVRPGRGPPAVGA